MRQRDTLPPIADYGLIGNRHSCALVERTGSIDWCCLPHLDNASVFGALMDVRRGGHWRIGPAGAFVSTRAYRGNSPVLVTRFRCGSGQLRLTDFLPIRRGRGAELSYSAHSIVRIVECVEGEVDLEIDWKPRPNYARDDVSLHHDGTAVRASDDENPELVQSLYREIYRFAADGNGAGTQFLLIDSNLVEPEAEHQHEGQRRQHHDIGLRPAHQQPQSLCIHEPPKCWKTSFGRLHYPQPEVFSYYPF